MITQTKSLKDALKECGIKASCNTPKNKHGEWQSAESYFDCDQEHFDKIKNHPLIKLIYAYQWPKYISVRVESGWESFQPDYKISLDFIKLIQAS